MQEELSRPNAWLLVSAALAMLTIPGIALFYGGMVRKKNVVNTMGLAFLSLILTSLLWIVGWSGIVVPASALTSAGLTNHVLAGALALTLITGGVVERIRVTFFLAFGLLWLALVYSPIAHWLWGGGWLSKLGSLDFSGGAVVHICAGVTALTVSLLIGPRRGFGRVEMKPNNLPLSACGAALLWVGWCGLSAGVGQASMRVAAGALVAIQLAAASAALAWTAAEWIQRDKPTMLGTISGVVAGLVAISPAAGYVSPLWAVVVGIGAGGLCYMVVNFVKPILGYDDSLDVFGMHAVGGTWGMVAVGLFASTGMNPDGSDGLFYGYPYQFFVQCVAILAVWVYAGGVTFVLVKGLQWVLPSRVDEEAEAMGLDLAQHGERGYS